MKKIIVKALSGVGLPGEEIDRLVETPHDTARGDYAFPCFVLAQKRKRNPSELAKEIASRLKLPKEIERVEAVGPYLNFFVKRGTFSSQVLEDIFNLGDRYGSSNGDSERVMIEFSQANTHKAFHVGHVRGTSLGESLARILSFSGNQVFRANYQGDTGMHVAKWLWAYLAFHSKEPLQKEESWFANIYVEAVKKLAEHPEYESDARIINQKLDSGSDKELTALWKKTRKMCLSSLEQIYAQLETRFDYYFFESEVEERGKQLAKELVSKGIARVSDGATIIDFADYKEPQLGVWVLLRADGTALYSAKDLALAEKKFTEFNIGKALYVVGSEQRQHMYQLFKTLSLMKFKQAKKCAYVPVSLVRLPTGKMSSRTGDNVLYSAFRKELVEEAQKEISDRFPTLPAKEIEHRAEHIALAALKYAILKQDTNKVLVFDKKEALRFEGDTGPYLLYSYARAMSILRKSKKTTKKQGNSELSSEEHSLVSALQLFPERVARAAKDYSPEVIAHYAYMLAQTFNEFYHKEKVIGSHDESFRLNLVRAFTQTLKNALFLLGIPVIEEM
jgi:arginyl-tRNA synthetase